MKEDVYLAMELTMMQLRMQLAETIPALKLRSSIYRKLLEDVEEDLKDSRSLLETLKAPY
jgi:hypothetical protein